MYTYHVTRTVHHVLYYKAYCCKAVRTCVGVWYVGPDTARAVRFCRMSGAPSPRPPRSHSIGGKASTKRFHGKYLGVVFLSSSRNRPMQRVTQQQRGAAGYRRYLNHTVRITQHNTRSCEMSSAALQQDASTGRTWQHNIATQVTYQIFACNVH